MMEGVYDYLDVTLDVLLQVSLEKIFAGVEKTS